MGKPHLSTRELINELEKQGFIVEMTSNGHYKAKPPDKSKEIITMADSGDYRAWENNVSRLRSVGFVPPWEEPEEETATEEKTVSKQDYLDRLLDSYNLVNNRGEEQLLFTREAQGRWLVTIPEEVIIVDGVHGKGPSPLLACEQITAGLREKIQERIRTLQELEKNLA